MGYWILRLLPKNHLSHYVGKLAALRYPKRFATWSVRWFIKRYRVDTSEIARDVSDYSSLSEFFVRDLRPSARPIGPGVVSPVDGTITEYGQLREDRLLQVKDKTYSVYSLLRNDELAKRYLNGFFITFYLAPPDYHHIHSPVDGGIVQMLHIPGKLWPVNQAMVLRVDALFTVNERMVTVIESHAGLVSVVKVGATNVGSIALSYDSFVSNRTPRLFSKHQLIERPFRPEIPVKKGERIGTFQMGSSVVVLFEPQCFVPVATLQSGKVRLGMTIGEMLDKGKDATPYYH